ncbi:MAG: hypothetical protein ACKO8Z_15970 [Prosthecobacter sp.]
MQIEADGFAVAMGWLDIDWVNRQFNHQAPPSDNGFFLFNLKK